MQKAALLCLALASVLTVAQTTPVALRQDPKVEKVGLGYVVFRQTKESVWTAIAEAMTSYNWRPQTMDAVSGVVFFQADERWGSAWGSNNALVAKFTTKRVRSLSTWQHLGLEANLIVKTLELQRTEVRISAKFAGCNGWQAAFEKYRQCKWESLDTNGNLEQELLERISSKLTALSQAELYPAAKPDNTAVSSAREQVVLFEKIVAAFQLNAPGDRIMAELVDAKASLQTFTDSQQSLVLPKFSAALNKAAQQFATALNSKPEDRAAVLKAAMDSFAEGKRCFSNYQRFVQEVEPHNAVVSAVPSSVAPVGQQAPIPQQASVVTPVSTNSFNTQVVSDGAVLSRMIGIQAIEWEEKGGGAEITDVALGGAADLAGLQTGYVIRWVDDKLVRNPVELAAELAKHSPGSKVRIALIFKSTAMGWLPKETVVTLQQNP